MGEDGRCSCFFELPESSRERTDLKTLHLPAASAYRYQGQGFRLSRSQAAYAATQAHRLVAHA